MEARPSELDGGSGTGTVTATALPASGAAVGSSPYAGAGAGQSELTVVRATPDVAACAPDMRIAADEVVEVIALSTNTQVCFVSTLGAGAAKAGSNRINLTTSTAARRIKVQNLSDIWVYSAVVGEGVSVIVTKG
jgi:hypothetical protein